MMHSVSHFRVGAPFRHCDCWDGCWHDQAQVSKSWIQLNRIRITGTTRECQFVYVLRALAKSIRSELGYGIWCCDAIISATVTTNLQVRIRNNVHSHKFTLRRLGYGCRFCLSSPHFDFWQFENSTRPWIFQSWSSARAWAEPVHGLSLLYTAPAWNINIQLISSDGPEVAWI